MAQQDNTIAPNTLRESLENHMDILVLDIRPRDQREEWYIPGSVHVDAYESLKEGDLSVIRAVDVPQKKKVVTVCAAGRMSRVAAQALRDRGIDAYSLEGGMKGWSLAWNKATIQDADLTIVQLRRTGKGCLSYLIASGKEALVIDASLDIDVYRRLAAENEWSIKYVLDTHIHADHLSRSFKLAKSTNSSLYMPAQDKLKYDFLPIRDGVELSFGAASLRAIATPGHTLEGMSYLLNKKYLFTGDTLFVDGVGRPDLKANEDESRKRASMLYKSLRKLSELPENTIVLPGHISKPVPFDEVPVRAALKEVKAKVASLKLGEGDFIQTILKRIPPTPPNYLQVVEMNLVADLDSVEPSEVESGANRCAIS